MRGATLRQMRAFTGVAHHLSFVRAAQELHLTPSAVSLQIKELEQAAGLPLFSRQAKSISLTTAGEMLLVDVRQALEALQHADETLARLRSARRVTVGMISSAKYFVPRLLAQFREEHGDVDTHLVVGNRDSLLGQLRGGQVDLAVMGSPPGRFEGQAEDFAALPLGIVAAPEHELAQARAIPPAALADYEFIVRESGSGTRAALERYIREQRLELPRQREASSTDSVKQAVMANFGLAFLSLHAAALELRGGLLVALDVVGLPVWRRWFVVDVAADAMRHEVRALRRFILDRGTCGCLDPMEVMAGQRAAGR
jgi:DNA-binding transcriptional LysR family regulator